MSQMKKYIAHNLYSMKVRKNDFTKDFSSEEIKAMDKDIKKQIKSGDCIECKNVTDIKKYLKKCKMKLIIATANKSKFAEIKKILEGVPFEIVCLAALDIHVQVQEDGTTFLENAIKKTEPISKMYPDDLVVGEDSGLEVNVLGDRPGIFSSRYAGEDGNDKKNNEKLLTELAAVPNAERQARFRCVLALVKNDELLHSCEGILEGIIADSAQGDNGFGYDPIFYLPERGKTTAQLSAEEKNKISHRGQAFRNLKEYLTRIC